MPPENWQKFQHQGNENKNTTPQTSKLNIWANLISNSQRSETEAPDIEGKFHKRTTRKVPGGALTGCEKNDLKVANKTAANTSTPI